MVGGVKTDFDYSVENAETIVLTRDTIQKQHDITKERIRLQAKDKNREFATSLLDTDRIYIYADIFEPSFSDYLMEGVVERGDAVIDRYIDDKPVYLYPAKPHPFDESVIDPAHERYYLHFEEPREIFISEDYGETGTKTFYSLEIRVIDPEEHSVTMEEIIAAIEY